MSTNTKTDLTSPLSTERPIPETDVATVCQPGDTECLKRLVEAFSDCD